MDEHEWLRCDNQLTILLSLIRRGRLRTRKLQLYACACCRLVWHLLTDERSRRAVQVIEGLTDAGVDPGSMLADAEAAARDCDDRVWAAVCDGAVLTAGVAARSAALAVMEAASPPCLGAAHGAVEAALLAFSVGGGGPSSGELEVGHLALLLSDIFGNPFRPAPSIVTWATPAVRSLARAAYEQTNTLSGELEIDRLLVLSDALEEAGCDDSEVLGHLRSRGPHVRGCWAVHLALGLA